MFNSLMEGPYTFFIYLAYYSDVYLDYIQL